MSFSWIVTSRYQQSCQFRRGELQPHWWCLLQAIFQLSWKDHQLHSLFLLGLMQDLLFFSVWLIAAGVCSGVHSSIYQWWSVLHNYHMGTYNSLCDNLVATTMMIITNFLWLLFSVETLVNLRVWSINIWKILQYNTDLILMVRLKNKYHLRWQFSRCVVRSNPSKLISLQQPGQNLPEPLQVSRCDL